VLGHAAWDSGYRSASKDVNGGHNQRAPPYGFRMRSIVKSVGLCIDSSAQLPSDLVDRFRVAVVPATVSAGDREYLEGVDLSADGYYDLLASGVAVSTAEPSAGQFAVTYDDLAAQGCTEILSIHVASSVSGTVSAARLAAHRAEVPVRIVDTGTTSFGVACCMWAAAEALAAGASAEEATACAESVAPQVGHVFIADPARWCTDQRPPLDRGAAAADSVPVLGVRDGALEVLAWVRDSSDAIDVMVAEVAAFGSGLRVGVGMADRVMAEVADGLEEALRHHDAVDEVVRYRIGPSVGAHVGPRTVGCFMLPRAPGPSTRAAN